MAVRQDINVGLLAFVGLVGTMLLLIAVWGVEGWYAYEVDLLSTARYEIDRNQQWLDRREEQYANIGDTVGNATIYASAESQELPAGGYRYFSRERDVAGIPIHAAMAHMVTQLTGQPVSIEDMREVDRLPVSITNNAYRDYMNPMEVLRMQDSDAPANAQPGTQPGH